MGKVWIFEKLYSRFHFSLSSQERVPKVSGIMCFFQTKVQRVNIFSPSMAGQLKLSMV